METKSYIYALELLANLTKPAILSALNNLRLNDGDRVLDCACGIGNHAKWLLDIFPKVHITGIDISPDHIGYSKEKLENASLSNACDFSIGDINKMDYEDDSFDLIWCADSLWLGSKDAGCAALEPYDILRNMKRITKKGGKIALVFWSSQRLLPGFPILEAKLNATRSASLHTFPKADPDLHFMNAPMWFNKTGLKDVNVRTFGADIAGALDQQQITALQIIFDMLWAGSENEVTPETWKEYKALTDLSSDKCILKDSNYTGFITYTVYTARV